MGIVSNPNLNRTTGQDSDPGGIFSAFPLGLAKKNSPTAFVFREAALLSLKLSDSRLILTGSIFGCLLEGEADWAKKKREIEKGGRRSKLTFFYGAESIFHSFGIFNAVICPKHQKNLLIRNGMVNEAVKAEDTPFSASFSSGGCWPLGRIGRAARPAPVQPPTPDPSQASILRSDYPPPFLSSRDPQLEGRGPPTFFGSPPVDFGGLGPTHPFSRSERCLASVAEEPVFSPPCNPLLTLMSSTQPQAAPVQWLCVFIWDRRPGKKLPSCRHFLFRGCTRENYQLGVSLPVFISVPQTFLFIWTWFCTEMGFPFEVRLFPSYWGEI